MYELEFRRRQNGETIDIVSFPTKRAQEKALAAIVGAYGLEPWPAGGGRKKPGEIRYTAEHVDYAVIARTDNRLPMARAAKTAKRVFGEMALERMG